MKKNKASMINYIVGLLVATVGSWVVGEGMVLLINIIRKRIGEAALMLEKGYDITYAIIYVFGALIALFIIITGICILYIAAKKAKISIVRKTQKKNRIIICAKCFRYHKKNR